MFETFDISTHLNKYIAKVVLFLDILTWYLQCLKSDFKNWTALLIMQVLTICIFIYLPNGSRFACADMLFSVRTYFTFIVLMMAFFPHFNLYWTALLLRGSQLTQGKKDECMTCNKWNLRSELNQHFGASTVHSPFSGGQVICLCLDVHKWQFKANFFFSFKKILHLKTSHWTLRLLHHWSRLSWTPAFTGLCNVLFSINKQRCRREVSLFEPIFHNPCVIRASVWSFGVDFRANVHA